MTDIGQTTDGDIDVTSNSPYLVTGVDEVEQLLRQRLRTFYGEWFLDTEIGVPYFQDIFQKNPNPVSIESAFKNVILNTPGFQELSEFQLDIDASLRSLTLTFSGISTSGIIDFSEVLAP